jgi:hypothetical protein
LRHANLALDGQTFSDLLSILGTITAAGQLAAGLKLQKLGPAFVIAEEGQVTAAELARVSAVLKAQTLAKAVEAANKAMNYAGLIWGEVTFIDQMMSISQQEDSGAMTHAAARRARAGAVSSAVQNHVIFIAGILKEHAEQAKAAEHEHPVGERAEDHNGETVVPRTAQPVPLSERQATKTELQEALPPDLRHLFLIDDSLPGDTVQVEPTRDPATPWLITDITVRCGPDARPATVALHTETVRTMQRYQGFSARVWRVLAWIADRFHMDRLNPENATRFAAQGEIQKLPRLIEKQVERMRLMEPNARDEAEAELDSMKQKLESSVAVVTNFEETGGPGFVAAPGVAKAKQKAYAKLSAERRKYRPGDSKHKEIRYEMYKMTGGDWSPERWGEAYDNNMRNPNKANAIVATEFQRLGWGEAERTIEDLGDGEVRRLDIATASNITKRKRGIEIKAYESGLVTATDKNKSEVERDARLVKEHGWQITWIIIDCDVSAPLLRLLYEAGITVEYRITTGPETEFHSRVLPRRK